MNILSLDGVSKTLIGSPLFRDVSLGIEEGERLGLVGRNGAGKTTFLRVLAGDLEPDEGSVARRRDLRVSTLPQSPAAAPGTSLRDFLLEGGSPLARLVRDYEDAAHGRVHADARRMDGLTRRMEAEGGFHLERSYASLCTEFGLPDIDAGMDGMSGGMVKKAALARCLAVESDLVLLDEPTNHLDLDSIELLERRLKTASFAFVLVTHDRAFLEAACARILEIDRASLWSYPGNWSSYLEMRRERWNALEKADARREAILKIELKWLNRGARARATKSERRKERIRDMQASGLERPEAMGAFSSASRRLGRKVLEMRGVSKSYGGRRVFEPFSYEFTRGDRIGVVGPNGCGKTTLLSIVAGTLVPDEGTVDRGANTVATVFDQTARDLPPDMRVLDFARGRRELTRMADGSTLDAERLLDRFLFDRTMHDQRLSTLSGGELRRLQLVSLLAEAPNLLALDEPTNDLDIDTIELLEDYLEDFEGCVIVVSHDRAFLDGVTRTTLAFDGEGGVSLFPGSYGEYRAALEAEVEVAPRPAGRSPREAPPRDGTARDATRDRPRKPTWAERKEYEGILDEIEALEAERSALEVLFASGGAGTELEKASRRYAELGPLIEARTARWEELAALIDV